MNPRTPGLTLAKAIPGFLLYKTAAALSPNTLHSYQDHLKLWLTYTGEVAVERITPVDLCAFLTWLRYEYRPQRITGNTPPLAARPTATTGSACPRFSPGPPDLPHTPLLLIVDINPKTREKK